MPCSSITTTVIQERMLTWDYIKRQIVGVTKAEVKIYILLVGHYEYLAPIPTDDESILS